MQSSGSVEIDRPIEAVFEYTNKNIVVEDEVIEMKNDGGLGTTFRSVTEERGRGDGVRAPDALHGGVDWRGI